MFNKLFFQTHNIQDEDEKEVFSEEGNHDGDQTKWNEGYINLPVGKEFQVSHITLLYGTVGGIVIHNID